jgi:uncharacterized Ntn-hydrolase superfamily protein
VTYSIVAFDEARAELGAAVPSHWSCVGPLVPWQYEQALARAPDNHELLWAELLARLGADVAPSASAVRAAPAKG